MGSTKNSYFSNFIATWWWIGIICEVYKKPRNCCWGLVVIPYIQYQLPCIIYTIFIAARKHIAWCSLNCPLIGLRGGYDYIIIISNFSRSICSRGSCIGSRCCCIGTCCAGACIGVCSIWSCSRSCTSCGSCIGCHCCRFCYYNNFPHRKRSFGRNGSALGSNNTDLNSGQTVFGCSSKTIIIYSERIGRRYGPN